jgi:hypothetical protein
LDDYIKQNDIDKIITTGPPHSVHLIGLGLKKKNPALKWMADFRDPWTEWDLLDTLKLSNAARAKHKHLEHEVLTKADEVITIAPYHVQRLEVLSKRKVTLLTNGFDDDDFRSVIHTRTSKFTIRHIGIVDELRDPIPFMEVVEVCCKNSPDFFKNISIEFVGNVNSAFKEYVKANGTLNSITKFVSQMPHNELLKTYGQTDLQLLILAHTVIAPGNLPGKFFEYLASGNAILALGPTNGDAAAVLHQTKAGEIFEREDSEGIQKALFNFYTQWKSNDSRNEINVSMYTRKNLTIELVKILESL